MPMPEGFEDHVPVALMSPPPQARLAGCCCCCSSDEEPNVALTSAPSIIFQQPTDEQGYYWCQSSGEISPNAIKVGVDKDGGDIYVGRATHEGELIPAKVVPNHYCAYVAWDGEEHRKDEYELLCRGSSTVIWQECQGGMVPENAVAVGFTKENERLYIGRVFHDGTHTPGKIHPSHGVCYIPYDGQELSFPVYEVLILQ